MPRDTNYLMLGSLTFENEWAFHSEGNDEPNPCENCNHLYAKHRSPTSYTRSKLPLDTVYCPECKDFLCTIIPFKDERISHSPTEE